MLWVVAISGGRKILRAAHQTQDAVKNRLTFTRLARLNLMHKDQSRALQGHQRQAKMTPDCLF